MPLHAAERERVRDKRVVLLLARAGHVAQETLRPLDWLERHGCAVTPATLDGGGVRFDPLCTVLAVLEAGWDPTAGLLRRVRREGRLTNLPSIERLADAGQIEAWLDGFDAVMVPGGHGPVFGAFIRHPLVVEAVARFHASGRVVGLLCHAPFAAAQGGESGLGFVAGRTVSCWPRRYERALAALPVVGRYFLPFGQPVGELLQEAGARVHDSAWPRRAVHAAIDGRLVTGRGPWSTRQFATALLRALVATPSAAESSVDDFATSVVRPPASATAAAVAR